MNSIVKNLLILFVCCIFISCEEYTEKPEVLTAEESIVIKNGCTDYKYKKIIIEDHDYYFRSWPTRNGSGSNLVHNPNCSTCKNKNYE
jgi:hypothetical protein